MGFVMVCAGVVQETRGVKSVVGAMFWRLLRLHVLVWGLQGRFENLLQQAAMHLGGRFTCLV